MFCIVNLNCWFTKRHCMNCYKNMFFFFINI